MGSYRLPQTSQPKPQNTAPTSKPAFAAKLKNGALKVNSSITGARISPVINYFLLGGRGVVFFINNIGINKIKQNKTNH